MNVLLQWLDHPLTHRVGWALIHSLWQGAFVAVLFALLRFVLRRASAQARYLAGCFCLLLLVVAPLITFLLLATSTRVELDGGVADFPATGAAIVATDHSPAHTVGRHASRLVFRSAEILERMVPWLVAAWFAGVLVCSFQWVNGLRRARSLRTHGTEPVDPAWIEMLEDLKCRLNVSRPIQLLKSALVEVPTVIGWMRPVILLPVSSLTGLTPSQLEAILAHELAHVYRNDYFVNAIQNALETVLFYHPAVWWISRCVRDERENCCDDLAVKVCGNRVAYARALATMEELRSVTPQFALAAAGGSLLHRVRRLLGLPVDGGASARQVGGLALLAIGLLLAIGGVGLMLAPARYQAVARIRIDTSASRQTDSVEGRNYSVSDPKSFQTAVAMIQSPLVLNKVVETLGLRDAWGKRYERGRALSAEEALKLLRQRTRTRPLVETSLVDIQASSDDPAEAAAIANEIARSYQSHELELVREQGQNRIKVMEEQLVELGKEVFQAQTNVDRLRMQLKISDPDPGSLVPTPTLSVETVRLLQNQSIMLKDEEVFQDTNLRNLQKLDKADLREAMQTALTTPDAALASLMSELNLADQRLLMLEKDYTKENPTYQNASKARQDLDAKIDKRITGILLGLQNRLDATRARLEELDKRIETARTNDLAMAEKSRPYFEAKRHLAELLQFKSILGMKIASEATDLRLPKSNPWLIVDNATTPSEPVFPNRSLAAALIAFGALFGITGLVMLRDRSVLQPSLHPA